MINIQEYQIKKKEDEIVKEALVSGSLLTTYDVVTRLNNFFTYKTAGLPYYKNLNLRPYSKSDKKVWNDSFKCLEEDLNVAYHISNNQEKSVLEEKNLFDSEILELYKSFDELNSEIELAKEYSNKGIVYYPYVINFNDLHEVNGKNLYNHNIPYTTCEIDYDKSILRNELHSTPNDKLDLSKAEILIYTNSKNIKTSGDVNSIVSENSTDILTVQTSSNSNALQSLTIEVILDKVYEISKINLSCFNIANATAILSLSEDDENYIERDAQEGGKEIFWVFNKRKVKRFKIYLKKTSNDLHEKNHSLSVFSIVNISAYNDRYSLSGVYTSNEIRFTEPVTDMTIFPTHNMPPSTDISYFIGYEDRNNDVEWYPIKPGVPLDLNLLYKEEMDLNYVTSDVFGRWDFDRETGKRLFYIHELPKDTNLNSIELRAGHSQWLIERLDMTAKYGQEYPKDGKVNINDYSKAYVSAMAPLDMTMTDIRCEKSWNYFVMSSYVVCDKETIVENRHFLYEFTKDAEGRDIETLDIALLVNGRRIFAKDNNYSFKLKAGENSIKIMVLFGNQDISDIENLKFISHNFNLLSVSSQVFAGPNMQRMSYNFLHTNISEKELRHYGIKTVDGTDYIVTKVDPNYVLNPWDPYNSNTSKMVKSVVSNDIGSPPTYDIPNIFINNSEYLRMYIKFKHMLPYTLENLTNDKKDSSIRCRLMARLSSSDISVSPMIKRIKVVGT